ncbi:DUF2061 domain-containing protein [Sphingomonas piscis]|uniref:DUF2061 domain-containing protein n=1 Tax=Sphingomonas piscis TaxID=2714943 RepID=A0A6G7YNG3_9SPHN|nr:DUF2061 domain-containing protein [Sphingomonas piscis]QIK78285.1 DUF2061 domain-containing protein [Sphingomonas piscis]
MSTDFIKTMTYLAVHLTVAFTIGYIITGSIQIAGLITLIEPCANAVAFFFHEKAWKWRLRRKSEHELGLA